jgi:hypothetical protein
VREPVLAAMGRAVAHVRQSKNLVLERKKIGSCNSNTPNRNQRLIIRRHTGLTETRDLGANAIDARLRISLFHIEYDRVQPILPEQISPLAGFGGGHGFGNSVGVQQQ